MMGVSSVVDATQITVGADATDDGKTINYYDIRGNIPVGLPQIPKLLLKVRRKRGEIEVEAMRTNWVYMGLMNPRFLEIGQPTRINYEEAIGWIK